MRDPITPQQFSESDGVDDWRVVAAGASAAYRIPSFTAGGEFVARVAVIADELDHHPDVDLRVRRVVLRTTTHSARSLTELDVALARRVTAVARELGFAPDPGAVPSDD